MTLSRRSALASALALTAMGQAYGDVVPPPVLDGIWEGRFTDVEGPGLSVGPSPFPTTRIWLSGDSARVFVDQDGNWQEWKAGSFVTRRLGTNVAITSIQNDPDAPLGSSWVETWSFVGTLRGPETLFVTFTRTVNNNQIPTRDDEGQFVMIRVGEFRRVARDV